MKEGEEAPKLTYLRLHLVGRLVGTHPHVSNECSAENLSEHVTATFSDARMSSESWLYDDWGIDECGIAAFPSADSLLDSSDLLGEKDQHRLYFFDEVSSTGLPLSLDSASAPWFVDTLPFTELAPSLLRAWRYLAPLMMRLAGDLLLHQQQQLSQIGRVGAGGSSMHARPVCLVYAQSRASTAASCLTARAS